MLIFKLFVLFVLLLMTKYYINLFSETKRLLPQKRLRLLIIVKTNLTICFHHSRFVPRHSVTKTLNSQTLNLAEKKTCCLQLLVFLRAKESQTITPLWHWRRQQVFLKSCCHHEGKARIKEMVK